MTEQLNNNNLDEDKATEPIIRFQISQFVISGGKGKVHLSCNKLVAERKWEPIAVTPVAVRVLTGL